MNDELFDEKIAALNHDAGCSLFYSGGCTCDLQARRAKVEAKIEKHDACALCGAGFTVCRCRHQLQERMENMARLVGAYETIHHREVNGWTVTLFRNVSHNGTQPHGSYSASVRENATENVLAFYGETREAVEREVLRIVGVSPLDAAALVEENAALRRRLDNACAALRLGMSHLKGFYPVPYKEAEVLATMQAAIDDANAAVKGTP